RLYGVHVSRRAGRVRYDHEDVHHAGRSAHAGLYHRSLRLIFLPADRDREESNMMSEHTAKAFDVDLQEIARKVTEMGGAAEKERRWETASAPSPSATPDWPSATVPSTSTRTSCSARSRRRRS